MRAPLNTIIDTLSNREAIFLVVTLLGKEKVSD